jgi:hypothetical protein
MTIKFQSAFYVSVCFVMISVFGAPTSVIETDRVISSTTVDSTVDNDSIAAAVTAEGNDTGVGITAADTSGENDTLVDSVFAPHSLTPLFLNDSSLKETGDSALIDSLHIAKPSDTSVRPDSCARKNDSVRAAMSDSARQAQLAAIRPSWLYPGISLDQHALARQTLGYFYNFDWNNADKSARKLQRLEKKGRLPPLSYLLMVGIRVLRIQFGEYENYHVRKGLLHDIEKLTDKGLELANPEKAPDSCLATDLFITGGIKGFVATLEIDRNPINAALNGLSSVKYLEKAFARDSSLHDACLGIGLFNCVMAKAPLLVRGALSVIGRNTSLAKGLANLRASAYRGCYTSEIARLYLIDFLSPYLGDEANEKQKILRSFERDYPANPYFMFLELEENLCFHPHLLFGFSYKERVLRQIRRFKTADYSTARYASLVKWQYLLLDPLPTDGLAPDKNFDLRGFAFYPVFLQALREKIVRESGSAGPAEPTADRARQLRFIKATGAKAERMLDASEDLSSSRKGVFLWHIRDALRIHN